MGVVKRALPVLVLLVLAALIGLWWLRREVAALPGAKPARAQPAAQAQAAELVAARDRPGQRTLAQDPAIRHEAAGAEGRSRPAVLHVSVRSADTGEPVERVYVSAWDAEGRRMLSGQAVETDEEGTAELEVPPHIEMIVSAQGLSAAGDARAVVAPLSEGETRALALEVSTEITGRFRVRVLDGETRAPIGGALVGLAESWDGLDEGLAARTDGAGLATVTFHAWRGLPVLVQAAGYGPAGLEAASTVDGLESEREVLLWRNAALRVRLLGAGSAPLADARVSAGTESHRFARPEGSYLSLGQDPVWNARTGTDGVAVLDALPARIPLRVEARAHDDPAWSPRDALVLGPSETREVTWRIGAGATLRVLVLETDGRPARDVEVWMQPADRAGPAYLGPHEDPRRRAQASDAHGRLEFDRVDAGSWWVGPAAPDSARLSERSVGADAIAPFAQLVEIAADVPPPEVEVRLERGLATTGRVVDAQGRPAPDCYLLAHHVEAASAVTSATSGSGGAFELGPLARGTLEIVALGQGTFATSTPVRAFAGERDVVVRLQAGATVRGAVVDAETRAPVPASIVVLCADGWTRMAWATGPKAVFDLGGLPAGLHALGARTEDGRAGTLTGVDLGAGDVREVVLEVRAGARVRIACRGPRPVESISAHSQGAVVWTDGIEKGLEREIVVPAGDVILRCTRYPERVELDLPLKLAAGETRTVVFDDGWR